MDASSTNAPGVHSGLPLFLQLVGQFSGTFVASLEHEVHWRAREFVDHGVSGAKGNRPALNTLLREARRRTIDVVVVTGRGIRGLKRLRRLYGSGYWRR